MFSILAVSHGDTARAMVASARELTFCDAEIETVSIYAETSVADARVPFCKSWTIFWHAATSSF